MNFSGLKLYRERSKRGLTLKSLSALSGLSDNTINSMEKSYRKTRLRTWQIIANALEIDIEDLLENEPSK